MMPISLYKSIYICKSIYMYNIFTLLHMVYIYMHDKGYFCMP